MPDRFFYIGFHDERQCHSRGRYRRVADVGGDGVGLVKIQPAAEIVREIYVEAHSILMRFGTLAAELQPREGCIRSQDFTD